MFFAPNINKYSANNQVGTFKCNSIKKIVKNIFLTLKKQELIYKIYFLFSPFFVKIHLMFLQKNILYKNISKAFDRPITL